MSQNMTSKSTTTGTKKTTMTADLGAMTGSGTTGIGVTAAA
jgi:hypothetical protein